MSALDRHMADRDAAARALADLVVGIDVDRLPAELREPAQEYSDLALLEDLAFEMERNPDLCPYCGEPYARHSSIMRGPHGQWACYYDGAHPTDDDLDAWLIADEAEDLALDGAS